MNTTKNLRLPASEYHTVPAPAIDIKRVLTPKRNGTDVNNAEDRFLRKSIRRRLS